MVAEPESNCRPRRRGLGWHIVDVGRSEMSEAASHSDYGRARVSSAGRFRILLVTAETHPTFRSDVRVLFGKYLPRHGVASDIFAMTARAEEVADWPAGRALLGFLGSSTLLKVLSTLGHDIRLPYLVGKGYDAVVVRDRVLAGAVVALTCLVTRVPFVYWASFAKPESRVEFAWTRRSQIGTVRSMISLTRGWLSGKLLYSFVLRCASYVFVQSDAMRDSFVSRGIDPHRMTSVPMGIDADEFMLDPTVNVERSMTSSRFVYLGDLASVRSPEIMVQAIAMAAHSEPGIRLDLVGDALELTDRKSIRKSIEELGQSSRVRVTGWTAVSTARELARGASAGLSMVPRSPTLDLSSPTKLVEYFALGLPVLANDSPDQASLLAAIGADTVNCNAEDLAAAMVDVVRRPSHYREQARRGREFVNLYRGYSSIAAHVATVLVRVMLGNTRAGDDSSA